tara:strand:+ start:13108 stop:14361 length:1254 start_codon:yes stop_codon:yes gene_type:complete
MTIKMLRYTHVLLIMLYFFLLPSIAIADKSLSMTIFVNSVWKTNPGILSAQSEIERANSQFLQSRRPIYNPTFNIDGQKIQIENEFDTYTAGLSQTIDVFDKRGARTEVGENGLAEARASLANQKLNLASAALRSIAEYRTAQAVVKLATYRTDLLYKFKELNERKFNEGDIPQDALDMAFLAYAQAISQQADEEVLLENARQRLEVITGFSSTLWPRLPSKLPEPLKPSIVTKEQWVNTLPLIGIYNARVAIARAAVRVAQTNAKADPTFSFRSGTEDKEFLIGGTLNVPLFVRNDFHDQVNASNYQEIAVEQTRMNVHRKVKASLQATLSRYNILQQAAFHWNETYIHSLDLDGGVALLNRLWEAGEMNTTTYIIQVKQHMDSQIAGAELTGKAWSEWFSAMEASGQLNVWLTKK